MKNITKISLIIGIILTLFLIYYLYLRDLNEENEDKIEYSENVEIIEDENDNKDTLIEDTVKQETEKLPDEQIKPEKEKPLPTSKKLEAAFIPQAPYHDWSEPWQNACEEAALLTLHHYILGDKEVSPEQVKQEILNMLSWQDKYFGSHKDLNMAEVAEMAENYLGHKNVKVTYEIKIEDIKKEVASGNPVLIPAAGRVLNNPNFTPPTSSKTATKITKIVICFFIFLCYTP